MDSEYKEKRNGDDKIGREQTIVIKLSMRSRQSNKALIRFNHHEITALRKVHDNSSTNTDPPSV